jgi:hypothetical protein
VQEFTYTGGKQFENRVFTRFELGDKSAVVSKRVVAIPRSSLPSVFSSGNANLRVDCTGVHMGSVTRFFAVVFCFSLLAIAANSQTVTVDTGASETATYGITSQSAGPFPWSDLGITASASVTPGVLNVTTGGSTSFKLDSTVTAGESFVAGSTVLNLGYTPSWTGTFKSEPGANGGLSSNFVYNIGPFSGSTNLLNVPLNTPGSTTGLAASLNSPVVSPPVASSSSVNGPGISAGIGVQAQACFIVCATVASANVSFNVGSQIQQNIVAAPTVVYGDLVWESTSQTYSASDHPTFVAGSLGNIANVFSAPPASLGLTTGQTFYYNFLPVVELAMPVINQAQVNVPASISASYEIFGFGGSESWPLGDLYTLNTGAETFNFNANFNADTFYSVPLDYTAPNCVAVACFGASYTVPGDITGNPVSTPGGSSVPGDTGPCGGSLLDCNVNVPGGPGSPGGYGLPNLGPLFPGDPDPNNNPPICGPVGTAFAGECINKITQTPNTPTPEPGGDVLLAVGLLGLVALTGRRLAA